MTTQPMQSVAIANRLRSSIGIGVSVNAVRAVYVRGRRVVWSCERECDGPESLEATLDTVLSTIPRTLPGVRVVVAVGPARSQLRLVHGLPQLKNSSLMSALVQQDPSRFFLRNGTPLLTTGVQVVEQGTWVGAIEQPAVEAVVQACRRKRLRRVDVIPTAAILHLALDENSIDWEDGDVAISVQRDGERLLGCRRRVVRAGEERHSTERRVAAPTPDFDGDAIRFADAIAATRLQPRSTLALPSRRSKVSGAPLPRWRLALAALCLIAAGILALAAPGIAAARAERRLHADLTRLGPSSTRAFRVERELGNRAALLRELTEFDRSTRSMTLSLAALTRAIRPPSMLVSVRADSTGGTFVALAPSAAALVEMLSDDPELVAPRIVGPVIPQVASVAPVPSLQPAVMASAAPVAPPRTERVTIHFLWRDTSR